MENMDDKLTTLRQLQDLGLINTNTPVNDDYRWDVTPNDLIAEFEHGLKGEVFQANDDPETPQIEGKWIKIEGQQLLSDEGIRILIEEVKGLVNKVMFFSNLTPEAIRLFALRKRQNVAQILFLNHEKYKIDKAHLNIIADKAVYIIYVACCRALNGDERRSKREGVTRNYSVIEGLREMEKREGRGWIPNLFRR